MSSARETQHSGLNLDEGQFYVSTRLGKSLASLQQDIRCDHVIEYLRSCKRKYKICLSLKNVNITLKNTN